MPSRFGRIDKPRFIAEILSITAAWNASQLGVLFRYHRIFEQLPATESRCALLAKGATACNQYLCLSRLMLTVFW